MWNSTIDKNNCDESTLEVTSCTCNYMYHVHQKKANDTFHSWKQKLWWFCE